MTIRTQLDNKGPSMRYAMIAAILTVCVGCDEMKKMGEEKRQPAAPPGVAPPAGGGGIMGMEAPRKNAVERRKPNAIGGSGPARKSDSIIGKKTAEVVDMTTIRDDPNIQPVLEQKLNITDPVSGVATLYFRMAGQASTFGMQGAIRLYQAQHEKFPSLEEFKKIMKDHRVEFAKLRPYEMYAYDEETGDLAVMQDLKLKAEIYAKHGLDPADD
ncbi:hypothetical protein CA54_45140 [Symmachiella macrocystis]|uniref:Uncharacterized protein n=1 Tax=Symmachiella macrocystis TaxID=2527985 RepID=A0A5C6BFR1_9PLAN|nr:hypothetical protein [Symmachiella macrocystis]TWU09274.1 hypothetical protein CA54_45140 [Symmachiella macrocystis]